MKKLCVWTWLPPAEGAFPPVSHYQLIQIEAVAVRAGRMAGMGNAAITFEAKDTAGQWYTLRKKDNRGISLPKSTTMVWKGPELVEVRGLRGVYSYETEEVAM